MQEIGDECVLDEVISRPDDGVLRTISQQIGRAHV